jgi:hypothetical protein
MILEDELGCITEHGNYIPYYDQDGRCVKDVSVYEHKDWRQLTNEERRFFDLYYRNTA